MHEANIHELEVGDAYMLSYDEDLDGFRASVEEKEHDVHYSQINSSIEAGKRKSSLPELIRIGTWHETSLSLSPKSTPKYETFPGEGPWPTQR